MFKALEPARMGRLELGNRFVRSATWDATAEESGAVTDNSLRIYEGLAAGGIGLITTAYAFVSESGHCAEGQYGIHSDDMTPDLARLTMAAHRHGVKIMAQIVHSGIQSAFLSRRGRETLAPSPQEGRPPHRVLTEDDIAQIIADFAAAAGRAREAGFDAVQLHGAHGFLFSQFLSPLRNRREDRWGGSAENRRRFHVETVRKVRAAVGPDFTVSMKFGIMDDADGGATLDEGIAALQAMAEAGLDAVEISGGIGQGGVGAARANEAELPENLPFRERAAAAKRAVNIPLTLVSGIRRIETAEEIVAAGDADFIALSRPLIREPNLIARWTSGDYRRAKCITCNKCFGIVGRGEPLECGEERRIREEALSL